MSVCIHECVLSACLQQAYFNWIALPTSDSPLLALFICFKRECGKLLEKNGNYLCKGGMLL